MFILGMSNVYRYTLLLLCMVSGSGFYASLLSQELDSLARRDTVTLPTITVKSELIEQRIERSTISLQVLQTQQLDRMVATDPISALELVPGLTIYDEQPSIRGSSGYTYGAGTRVLTLLNGLPLVTPDLNSASFDMLPIDAVQQIEVLKGASSVIYGSGAMGGVINLMTQSPSLEPRTQIRSTMRLFDRPANRAANWSGATPTRISSLHLLHSRRWENGYGVLALLDLIDDTGYRKEEIERRLRAWIMQDYSRSLGEGKHLKLALNTTLHFDSTGTVVAWGGYPDSALIAGPGFLSKVYIFEMAVDPTIQLSVGKSLHTFLGRLYYVDQRINTGQDSRSWLQYGDYRYQRSLGGSRFQLTAGLNAASTQVRSDSTFGTASGLQAAAYAQLQANISEKFQVVTGVRWQYEAVEGDTAQIQAQKGLAPRERRVTLNEPILRLGSSWQVHRGTFLRASWGQALRSPSVAERYTTTTAGQLTVLPNPKIEAERGWTAEVGIRQLLKWNRVMASIDLAVFRMQFRDMVEFWVVPDQVGRVPGFPFRTQNLSNARIDGIELGVQGRWQMATNWAMTWQGGITYIEPIDNDGRADQDGDARYQEIILRGVFFNEPDRPRTLKYRNKTLIRFTPTLEWKQLSLGVNYSYNGPMINVDKVFLQPDLLPGVFDFRQLNNSGWHILDLIFTLHQKKRGSWSISVFNLLNEEYMTIPGTLGMQRSYALQWKLAF